MFFVFQIIGQLEAAKNSAYTLQRDKNIDPKKERDQDLRIIKLQSVNMKLRNQLKELNFQLQKTIDKAANLQTSQLRKSQGNTNIARANNRSPINRDDPNYKMTLKQQELTAVNKQNEQYTKDIAKL